MCERSYAMRTNGPAFQQEDLDRAFADLDAAQLTLSRDTARVLRGRVFCVGCGGGRYTYNNTGSTEPGARVCMDCGVVQPGSVIYEQMFGRALPSRSSNYKRIHHWHERISQLLLMESQIPGEHMLAIGERLLDGSYTVINKDNIRAVLRSLGLQVYIEKWLQIIQRCTGIAPPFPGPVLLQRLDDLFTELQRPFDACRLPNRRNFLNYNYVFCRLFQKLGCTKFCMFFPLIRSRMKLRALDEMWDKMATSLGWETGPITIVPPFAVQLEDAAGRLSALRLQVASRDWVEQQRVPRTLRVRELDRRSPTRVPPQRSERRLVTLEQRPQTLALRLKRRRVA